MLWPGETYFKGDPLWANTLARTIGQAAPGARLQLHRYGLDHCQDPIFLNLPDNPVTESLQVFT